MLQLYDLKHRFIAGILQTKELKVEHTLATGDKELSFIWYPENGQEIPQEYYIRTEKDEYVVKENTAAGNGYRRIVAKLNLEEIEGRAWQNFAASGTALAAAKLALTDTGWTCVSAVTEEKVRNITLTNVSSYAVFEKILDAYTCEIQWDTFSKTVYLKEQIGSDKGNHFIRGFNLREVTDTVDSYDFITRIYPIGADGLTISEVNNGVEYLENHQYSDKVKTLIWEDSSYTDAQALMEDAKYKLNELSKPKRTIQIKVVDLAGMSKEYEAFAYQVGDIVSIVDSDTGLCEKQRITKTVSYLQTPDQNTCEISNTVLTFEDMQKQMKAAAECLDNITTDNGTVKGSAVDKIDVSKIIGIEDYIAGDMKDMKVDYLYAKTEFGAPLAIIGEARLNEAKVTNLEVSTKAVIKKLETPEAHVTNLFSDYAKFTTVEADNLSALEQRVDNLTAKIIDTDYISAHYAQIDFANIQSAAVGSLLARVGLISSAIIENGHVTGYLDSVNINANRIKAGTLSVDRLVINGNEESLIYALNNAGELTSTHCDTLDGGLLTQRTVTADHLVAGTITSKELNTKEIFASSAFINAISTNSIVVGAVTTANSASYAAADALNAANSATKTVSTAMDVANTANRTANDALVNENRGRNKWYVQKFSTTEDRHTMESLANMIPVCSWEWEDSRLSFQEMGEGATEYYSAYAKTYLFFTADTAITTRFYSDDGGTCYLNAQKVAENQEYTAEGAACTLSFRKGWNVLEVVWHQGYDKHGFQFGTTLSSASNCERMDCYTNPNIMDMWTKTFSIAKWCKNNDITYIDGGKLYTGSVTTEKINTTELFSSTAFIQALHTDSILVGAKNSASEALTTARSASAGASAAAEEARTATSTAAGAQNLAQTANRNAEAANRSAASASATAGGALSTANAAFSNGNRGYKKWYVEQFSTTEDRHTMESLANMVPVSSWEWEDGKLSYVQMGEGLTEYYSAYAKTYLLFTADTAITTRFYSDDGGTCYLNAQKVAENQEYIAEGAACTLSFRKGWNVLEVVWHQRHSGHGFQFGTTLSSTSNCERMDCYTNPNIMDMWTKTFSIAKWCRNNDITYIDGGKLYTGSVTADKISVNDLSALGASIGGFTISNEKIQSVADIGGVRYQSWMERNTGLRSNWFLGCKVGEENKFYVQYDGYVYANNANIEGTINATKLAAKESINLYVGDYEKTVLSTVEMSAQRTSLKLGGSMTTGLGTYILLQDDPSERKITMEADTCEVGTLDVNSLYTGRLSSGEITPGGNGIYNLGTKESGWANLIIAAGNSTVRGVRLLNGGTLYGMVALNGSNNVQLGNATYNTSLFGRNVWLNGTSTAVTSDERVKKDFITLENYEVFFDALKPCGFRYKFGESGRIHTGLKAQDVVRALEQSGLNTNEFAGVVLDDADKDYFREVYGYVPDYVPDQLYSLRYEEFIPLNIYMTQKNKKQIQEQQRQCEMMQRIIFDLQFEVQQLKLELEKDQEEKKEARYGKEE